MCMCFELDPSGHFITGGISEDFNSGTEEPAKKVLFFMLKSLFTKRKQAIAYYYTSNSVTGKQMKDTVSNIISTIENKTNFRIHFISSDMGGPNLGMWKEFGVNSYIPYCNHPDDPSRKLFFCPDCGYILKNIRNCLLTHQIILPDAFRNKHGLFRNVVSLEPFHLLLKHQNSELCPTFIPELTYKLIIPKDGFAKMKNHPIEVLFSIRMSSALMELSSILSLHGHEGIIKISFQNSILCRLSGVILHRKV